MSARDGYRVAVVGATGQVGGVMLRLLRERAFPVREVVPFASERSAGRELDGGLVVQPLTDETIRGFDLAIFSAGGSTSGEWAPRFVEAGAVVVDNSSKWRMADDVPLVVSEVNPDALDGHRGIIANPNCSTMQMVVALKPIYDAAGIERLVISTYQAVSGTGKKAVDELAAQVPVLSEDMDALRTDGASAMRRVEHSVHADTLAFNVVPMLGAIGEEGYTDEELKLRNESRKILDIPDLAVSPTCVRVPVMVGHAVAIRATFERTVDLDEANAALAAFPNLVVQDVPTPLEWAGRDETAVGRVRRDLADPEHSLNLFVVGDNLLKGAALNTVQLAELLHERGLVRATARA